MTTAEEQLYITRYFSLLLSWWRVEYLGQRLGQVSAFAIGTMFSSKKTWHLWRV